MVGILKTVTETWYDNGAYSYSLNGVITFIKYNTGDKVYFNKNGKVKAIDTHDDLHFTYGDSDSEIDIPS